MQQSCAGFRSQMGMRVPSKGCSGIMSHHGGTMGAYYVNVASRAGSTATKGEAYLYAADDNDDEGCLPDVQDMSGAEDPTENEEDDEDDVRAHSYSSHTCSYACICSHSSPVHRCRSRWLNTRMSPRTSLPSAPRHTAKWWWVGTCAHAYVHIFGHTRSYVLIRIHTSSYLLIHTHTRAYTLTRTRNRSYVLICAHTYSYACIRAHSCSHVLIRTHTCSYVLIHTHTYTHTYSYLLMCLGHGHQSG